MMGAPATVRPPRELPAVDGASAQSLTIGHDGEYADLVVGAVTVEHDEADDVTLDRVVLKGVDLSFTRLAHLRLRDALLDTCDLSNLSLVEPSLIRVQFRDCRMSGLAFEGGRLEDVSFTGCRGDVVSFVEVHATRLSFDQCQLPESDFRATNLTDLVIDSSELPRSQWIRARVASGRVTATVLDSVKGASGLSGVSIDHQTLVSAAAALADGLGIAVWDEPDQD